MEPSLNQERSPPLNQEGSESRGSRTSASKSVPAIERTRYSAAGMKPVQIKYQPERSVTFLGSPSIVRLPDGALLVTHDHFGPGCPRNHEDEESLTSVHRSEDDGATWSNVTHVMNAYWSSLFVHGGAGLPARRLPAVRLHRHPPQRRRRLSLDPPQGRRQRAAVPRRAFPRSPQLPLRAGPRCWSTRGASTRRSRTAIPACGAPASAPASSPRPSTPTCWTPPTGG